MIPRAIEEIIKKTLFQTDKILLVLGARQVGKTTLLKSLKRGLKNVLYLNCDIYEEKEAINTTSKVVLSQLLKNVSYLFLDEVQYLDNPGLTLKIIHDHFKNIKVIATGSSSFDIKNKLTDALTGRYINFTLYPLSLSEILSPANPSNKVILKKQADALLDQILLYGLYPEVYTLKKVSEKIQLLSNIVESYLFKDILSFQKVKHPQILKNLAKALAYQIGSQINENELASRLRIDHKTVAKYLDLLEKTFVIKRIYPFSQNPRREIGRRYKIYFIDLGIRNMLIGDFNPPNIRKDIGALWENFLIIERIKKLSYKNILFQPLFWRTYQGAEVDYLEKHLHQPTLQAFEIKHKKTLLSKGAKNFERKYNIPVKLINKENYLGFII